MPYNNDNRRVHSQVNTATRTVSYNSGGLNERFSKISQTSSKPTTVTRTSGPSTSSTPQSSSVFSRLRGAKPVGSKAIQNRLGKTVGGGIKKGGKNGPTPMAGVIKAAGGSGRRGTTNVRGAGGNKRVLVGKGGSKKQAIGGGKKSVSGGKKSTQHQKKKPATAEELDKALDNYMMKDPKTAQAKLDADMNAYMAEIEDISMDDAL